MITVDNKKNIRSFGRIRTKNITENDNNLMENTLPKYTINIGDAIDINQQNHLEIGFGFGESILHRAINNNEINNIGCETYIKGVVSLLNGIEINNIKNIKIFHGDARILLENIPDSSLDKVFILFPDPWPKKKHNKRRIINEEFLGLLFKKLKNNGILFFASDIINYVEWTIEKIEHCNLFLKTFNNINDCLEEPKWWIETKYQLKAKKDGRKSYFLEFNKNS